MTLRHAIFGSMGAVVLFCAGPPAIGGKSQSQILVERIPTGYKLRYQDPDFDHEWREYEVVAADRLIVSARPVIKAYSTGRWLYEYAITNNSESEQNVMSFSIQAAYGAEGFTVPDWEMTLGSLSIFTWTATGLSGIIPSATASGWSIVSDNLPVVREAQMRGASATDTALIDLPTAVRQRVSELERRNVTRTKTLAPGIATQIITIGQEGERDAKDVFAEASQRYPEWLREAAIAADARRNRTGASARSEANSSTAWVDQMCERLVQANAILDNNPSAARTYLRDFVRNLNNETIDDAWLESLRHALGIVVEHVIERLR